MAEASTMHPTARVAALFVAAAAAAPLVVAVGLVPSASGMGTHRQLGLPSCTWPAFFGIPCVTCGMTTSFAHAVRGQWVAAFVAQPAGLLLASLAALTVVIAAWVAVSGRPVHRFLRPLARGRTALVAVALLVLGWGWKIAMTRGGAA
jgi:hypothetical protein